jgi:hypothetical protein
MPHFKHDCMVPCCCTYAGDVDGKDVYASKTCIIIREGDQGPEYSSLPWEIAQRVADAAASCTWAAAVQLCNELKETGNG